MRTTGRRLTMVITVASMVVSACAANDDRVELASTLSTIATTSAARPSHTSEVVDTAKVAESFAPAPGTKPSSTASSGPALVGEPAGPSSSPLPITAPPPTSAPTTAPPAIAPLTENEAILAWNSYLADVTARDYVTAWTKLTGRYQVKYLGYDNFVRFWETVQGAGVRSYAVVANIPDGLTLELNAWYGRRKDGTVSNEVVDVDLIKEMVTGTILIDDYRFLGRG